MGILILNRQHAAQAPFGDWLGDELVSRARLFTAVEQAPGFSGFAGITTFTDYETNALIELEVLRLAREWQLDRIVATSEIDILRAGYLRTILGLPGQSGESALAFRDKIEMKRRILSNAPHGSVKVPHFTKIRQPLDVIEFIHRNGYPAIVKPVDGSGSQGTIIICSESDLVRLLALPMPRGMEIEAFIDGAQYHVDGLVVNGEMVLCWPSKYLGNCLSFTTGGITASTMLTANHPLNARLVAAAHEVLAALPLPPSTTFHLELFHTPGDELYFCEVASRTGGGLINSTLEMAFGINLTKTFVQAQAGIKLAVDDLKRRGRTPQKLLAWGLVPPGKGIFAGPTGTLAPFPWLAKHTWTMQEGTRSDGAQLSVDHMATFIVDAEDLATSEARLTQAWQWTVKEARWHD